MLNNDYKYKEDYKMSVVCGPLSVPLTEENLESLFRNGRADITIPKTNETGSKKSYVIFSADREAKEYLFSSFAQRLLAKICPSKSITKEVRDDDYPALQINMIFGSNKAENMSTLPPFGKFQKTWKESVLAESPEVKYCGDAVTLRKQDVEKLIQLGRLDCKIHKVKMSFVVNQEAEKVLNERKDLIAYRNRTFAIMEKAFISSLFLIALAGMVIAHSGPSQRGSSSEFTN